MLTGELPTGRFAPPSKKVQIDVRLDEVVLRALEKEPERRYQQASEMKTRVETITASPPADTAQPEDRRWSLGNRIPLVVRRDGGPITTQFPVNSTCSLASGRDRTLSGAEPGGMACLSPLAFRLQPFGQRGCSSVGRAVALQAIGQEFESPQLHQPLSAECKVHRATCKGPSVDSARYALRSAFLSGACSSVG